MQRANAIFKYLRAGVPALSVGLVLASLAGAGCGATDSSESVDTQSDALTSSTYDWLQFFGDGRHLGNNTQETELTQADVAGLTQLFHVQPDTTTYTEGPPVVLRNVSTSSGVRDLAFIETRLGKLYALDARTGATIWAAIPTNAQTKPTSIFTTTAPAIDPGKAYVYMYGFDGQVHKYDVRNGSELTGGGWPELVTPKPDVEKGITFLTYATDNSGASYLYEGTSGYGDSNSTVIGHLTAINLATGAQKVFNSMCSDQAIHAPTCSMGHGAIWGRSTMMYSPGTNRIYGGTGDGTFDPTNHFWGDTVLSLTTDGSGSGGNPLDSYTPSVFAYLQSADYDLGASSPALLPNSGTKYPNIALQAGKDNTLRVINLSNLSNNAGGAGPGHTGGELWSTVMDGNVDSNGKPHGTVDNAIAVWTNPADNSTWAFVPQERSLLSYRLQLDASGNPSLVLMWSLANPAYPGSAIIVANNVLYRAYTTVSGGPGMIEARDPVSNKLLWSSSAGIGGIHWQSPVVANGILYLADNSGFVTAFALPPQSSTALSRVGWTASVGSNTSGEAPSNMLDGNGSTRWSTGTAQANNGNQWFRVDMSTVHTLNQITLDAGTTSDFPRGYQLSVSNDGTTFSTVATGVGTSALTTVTFPTQSVRYFKVLQTGTVTPNWWSVYEVNAYYASATGGLTAYPRTGWIASAAYSNGADVPANVLDGSSTTRWSDGIPQSTTPLPSPAPYLQVNMAASQPFSQITLDSAGSTGDYLRNYRVLADNNNPPTTQIAAGTATGALTTITFASVTAQYIRVVQTSPASGVGSWWSIAEVKVWH